MHCQEGAQCPLFEAGQQGGWECPAVQGTDRGTGMRERMGPIFAQHLNAFAQDHKISEAEAYSFTLVFFPDATSIEFLSHSLTFASP